MTTTPRTPDVLVDALSTPARIIGWIVAYRLTWGTMAAIVRRVGRR